MKTVNVEKRILSDETIDVLLNINADENLRIQDENDGKRCLGFVDLKGQYMVENQIKNFHEFIECDIFAPSYKCDQNAFHVKLIDVSGVVEEGLLINLTFEIEGLNEEDSLTIEDEEMDLMGLEDLFEENENLYTNCRLIVAKVNDTYESIAARFDVSVEELKKANNEIEIRPKLCILIPKG